MTSFVSRDKAFRSSAFCFYVSVVLLGDLIYSVDLYPALLGKAMTEGFHLTYIDTVIEPDSAKRGECTPSYCISLEKPCVTFGIVGEQL